MKQKTKKNYTSWLQVIDYKVLLHCGVMRIYKIIGITSTCVEL